jgi:hypothetical protein
VSAYRDGQRIPTDLFEAAVWFASLKVSCSRCANLALFETAGLWWHFHGKHWDDSLRGARLRFYCSRCVVAVAARVHPAPLQPVSAKPTKLLPPPPDREWKRRLSRFKT